MTGQADNRPYDKPVFRPLTREPKRGEDPLFERNRAVIELRAAGWQLDRIARLFGITVERVRQIVSKGYEKRHP